MLKLSKTKALADELIKRTSSMLDEMESKMVHKDEEGDWYMKKKYDTEWSKVLLVAMNLIFLL